MRALVVEKGCPARLRRDLATPTPTAGEVLVRVIAAGVCSTDLEIIRGYMDFSGVLGHEFVGVVEDARSPLNGRRVVCEINCGCGTCADCRGGMERHCPMRTVIGILGRDGCFAEYIRVPQRNLHVVPQRVSDRQAVFVEPLAAAAHVLDDCPTTPDQRIAVIGTGRLGLLTAQVLARSAAALTCIGRNERTRDFLRKRGIQVLRAESLERDAKFDAVVECSGSPTGLELALRLVRPRGTIVLKSTYATPRELNLAPIVIHEVRVVGSRCGDFARAIRLLADGNVDVDSMITGVFPLDRAEAALHAAADPAHLKIVIEAP